MKHDPITQSVCRKGTEHDGPCQWTVETENRDAMSGVIHSTLATCERVNIIGREAVARRVAAALTNAGYGYLGGGDV